LVRENGIVRPEIAIMGGSFDPPHMGHMLAALYVLHATTVDDVYFFPVPEHPWDKKSEATYQQRVEMCQLMTSEHPALHTFWSLVAPSLAIHQLNLMKELYPTAIISWIMGEDLYPTLDQWEEWSILKTSMRIYVVRRSGSEVLTRHPGSDTVVLPLQMPRVSSSFIRQGLASGTRCTNLVPDLVRQHIDLTGLYKGT
jgi:nicotinate-nucleotide adenylyltransferase